MAHDERGGGVAGVAVQAAPASRRAPLLRRVLLGGAEALLAVSLVLVFFLVFMAILVVSLPTSTGLRNLVGPAPLVELPEGAGRALDLDLPSAERLIARLTRVQRKVKDKPAAAIAWSDTSVGTGLADRHAIQTFNASSATIVFGEGNELTLQGNSLVVLKGWEETRRTRHQRASLVVLDGEVRARVQPSPEQAASLEVQTDTTVAAARAVATPGAPAEFSVKVNPDRSSTFQVYDGSAEIVTAGTRVHLARDQAVTVDPSGKAGSLVALPARPVPSSPAQDATFYYRDVPEPIRFGWSARGGVGSFRFVLARDAELSDVVHEARVAQAELTHGNLKAGRYFWSVSGIDGWTEGSTSPPRRLVVVQDSEPPALDVGFPGAPVTEEIVRLLGQAEPGSAVFVGGVEVATDDRGAFEHAVRLGPGVNVVVVEAVDRAGNVTYRSSFVEVE